MDPIELSLSPALHSLLEFSQVHCVYGCCQLEAFGFEASLARGWVRRFGPNAVDDALAELDALSAACRDETRLLTCSLLEVGTYDRDSRERLVTFFAELRASLAAM